MIAISSFVLLFIFLFLPVYVHRISQKLKADRYISDIVICYGIGMILGNAISLWLSRWRPAAAVMGPPSVAQLSSAIKNKELLPARIAFSLLGLGLANYAGILVAWVVGRF